MSDEQDKPKIHKLQLRLTKREAHRMTRVLRWERASESVNLTLGPRK